MIRNERGTTLIAVIIALVILSAGLMALSKVQTDMVKARHVAEARSTAVSVARSFMEELRGQNPTTLVSQGPVTLNELGQIVPNGAYVGSVEVTAAGANMIQLRVLVNVPGTTNGQIELISLVYTG
jgi:Tfp pilus assembly protein PilV